MTNYNSAPKQTGKRLAAAVAAAVLPLTGCEVSAEQQAREDATRQVFTDVMAGKTVSKDPFGSNTFTVSIKDRYPQIDMNDDEAKKGAASYAYSLGEERIQYAFGIQYDPIKGQQELVTQAVCDTAAVNGLLTGDQLKAAQDQWDYYQQLGGREVLEHKSEYSDAYTEAFLALSSLQGTCTRAVGEALKTGADVTFVPAINS